MSIKQILIGSVVSAQAAIDEFCNNPDVKPDYKANYISLLDNCTSTSEDDDLMGYNVYGKFEDHTAHMASPVSKFLNQLKSNDQCKVFDFKHKEEAKRDFILVDDAIDMVSFLIEKKKTGIFNIGTGNAESFNKIAKTLISNLGYGKIKYINFPNQLNNKYQYFTQANISKLRALGYKKKIKNIEKGIKFFLDHF